MKISRRRGTTLLRLDRVEAAVLLRLLDDLAAALAPGHLVADDPVRLRLFPAAYLDDVAAADDFRRLTEQSLADERAERIESCGAELAASGGGAAVEIGIDAESGRRWITVLNDLRLALGTRLGVDEDDRMMPAPDDPAAAVWATYFWLTGVQDALVSELMR